LAEVVRQSELTAMGVTPCTAKEGYLVKGIRYQVQDSQKGQLEDGQDEIGASCMVHGLVREGVCCKYS
jgi:hypothetical protein